MNYFQIYGLPVDMKKMIHFKLNIGDTGIYGRSYLASALNDNEALKQMEQSLAVIARQKAVPRKLINYGDPSQPASGNELDDFIDYMNTLQKDEDIVVNKPTKIEEFSYAGGEINLDYMIQHTRKKIVAGIAPEFVMGMADQVNYSTAQVQLLAYVLAIYAKRKLFLKPLQKKVLDKFIKSEKLKPCMLEFKELNFEGPKEKQERVLKLWTDNVITLKQVNEELKIDFEGDKKYLDMRYAEFNNENAPEMPGMPDFGSTQSEQSDPPPQISNEEVSTGNSGDLTYTINDKRVKKIDEAITIPIEEGDTILGGKFRNKKILVKDIGENERGEPLINGKPILNVRLMPESYSLDSERDYETMTEVVDDSGETFPKNPTGTKTMASKYAIEIRKRFKDAYNQINFYLNQNKQSFQEKILTEAALPLTGIETIVSSLGVAINDLVPIVEMFTKNAWMKANYDIARRLKMGNTIPFNQQILQAMMRNQMGWIEKYGKEKETQLRSILTDGITQGDSIPSIKKEIKDILQTTSWRSEVIARSETIRTYNTSALESMRQSGVVDKVRYLTAFDDRVCTICRPLHNKVWDLNSNQIVMPVSGTHPNCFIDHQIPILTDKGYKPIGKIEVGDLVLTKEGKFRNVTKLLEDKKYKGKVYQIQFNTEKGRIINKLTMTPEHPVLTKEGWKKAEDLTENDEVQVKAKRCKGCNKLIPEFSKWGEYCTLKCANKYTAIEQFKNPEQHKIRSIKAAAQMNKEYKNGTRDKFKITKKANESVRKNGQPKNKGRPAAWIGSKNDKQIREKISKYAKNGGAAYACSCNKSPSRPQVDLFNKIKNIRDDTILNHPVKIKKDKHYVLDIALLKDKINVEYDGFYWHRNTQEKDLQRDIDLRNIGWTVIRFNKNNVHLWEENLEAIMMNHNEEYEFMFIKIHKIKSWMLKGVKKLYNFSVDEYENYIAKGICVHNCRCSLTPAMQNKDHYKDLRDKEKDFINGKPSYEQINMEALPPGATRVKDPSQAPKGAKIITGPRGGTYYVGGEQPQQNEPKEQPEQEESTSFETRGDIHNTIEKKLSNVNNIQDVQNVLNDFKKSLSDDEYQNIISLGACELVNTSVGNILKDKGFDSDIKQGNPKNGDEDLPPHYISVIKGDDGKEYVVDLVAEQFRGYNINYDFNDENGIHTMEEYKSIYDEYNWD